MLLVQRPFSIIYFDYINYFHNYDQNIKSIFLFQLQMVLGMTMIKCCVSVECQLKGISVNINILGMGLSFESLDWCLCIFSCFWYRPTSHTLSYKVLLVFLICSRQRLRYHINICHARFLALSKLTLRNSCYEKLWRKLRHPFCRSDLTQNRF